MFGRKTPKGFIPIPLGVLKTFPLSVPSIPLGGCNPLVGPSFGWVQSFGWVPLGVSGYFLRAVYLDLSAGRAASQDHSKHASMAIANIARLPWEMLLYAFLSML